ncbi:MAG: Acylphosphatase [Planctomycetota bacterium]|jgi:acylphosphatase
MVRVTSFLTGRVQGVGMRYAVHDLSRQFAVRGFVQNLQDGRVQIVAEGERDEIDRFLSRLREVAPGAIHSLDSFASTATGEYSRFEIRREEF